MIKLKKALIVMLTTVMLCGNTVMVYASETESAQTPESSETPESPDSQGGNNDDKNTGLDNGMQSNGNTLQDANAVSGPSVSASLFLTSSTAWS